MKFYSNQPTFLLCRGLSFVLITNVSLFSFSVQANTLPPPPRSVSEVSQLFKIYPDLVLNNYPIRQAVPIIVKGEEYFIQRAKLKELEIKLPDVYRDPVKGNLTSVDVLTLGFSGDRSDWISLNQVSEIKSQYDSATQSFMLNVPADWLPLQVLGRDFWYKPQEAQSGVGLLNNYDFYTHRPANGGFNSSLFTEQRFFSPYGVLSNSGVYTKSDQKLQGTIDQQSNTEKNDGYRRYNTTFQYDDPESAISFLAGDVITGNKNAWGSSVRLGGLQVQRNFRTRPDLITYPLPQFSGQAALPSAIDLIINGQKTASQEVQSGPFVLNNMPFINGKGEAVIVVTDAVGRQVSTAVPFYIASELLKPGLFDYSLSVGKIREQFGVKNFDYNHWAGSADARYGLTDYLTAEARTEVSDKLGLVGIGAVLKLGTWGVVNASATQSFADEKAYVDINKKLRGEQLTIGYGFQRPRFGVNVSYREKDKDYIDLSNLDSARIATLNSQKSVVANTYFATEKSGTFGIGYIQSKMNETESKLLNLSWAPVLPSYMRGSTISLSANHDFVQKDWSAAFQLTVPFSKIQSAATAGYNFSKNGDTGYVNFRKSVATDGGFGFDLTRRYNERSDDINQAQINYRNRYFSTDAGLSGSKDYNYWFGFSGSAVWMSGGLYFANRLGESFALIDTNKVADVPVHYENSIIGRSNKKGFVFVPSVTPYYAAKYSIDPINLPSNYNISQVENRIAAKLGSGVVIKFPVKKSNAAIIHLVKQDGKPVPVGSVVHRENQPSSYVGVDGIAFLEDLLEKTKIRVQMDQNQLCDAEVLIDLVKSQEQITVINPLICREVSIP